MKKSREQRNNSRLLANMNNLHNFRKTGACPAASTLLSYRSEKLSPEIVALVRKHLAVCEFCNAELRLLAHHQPSQRSPRTPEMPKDLRILAESILCK